MATKKTPAAGKSVKKTECPISRATFKAKARPVTVVINGQTFGAYPKRDLDSGSLGYFLNDKITIEVDGVPVKVQIGLNLTVIGSKELPADEAAAA
jgi:hypothetical protein